MNDFSIIYPFIVIIIIYMQQFIDDISKFFWHLLSYLGTSIFRRNLFADLYQTVNGNSLPVLSIPVLMRQAGQIPVWVVDQVRQLHLFLFRDNMPKGITDLFPDNTRRTAQKMNKRLILSMKITEKILGSFGKPADCH